MKLTVLLCAALIAVTTGCAVTSTTPAFDDDVPSRPMYRGTPTQGEWWANYHERKLQRQQHAEQWHADRKRLEDRAAFQHQIEMLRLDLQLDRLQRRSRPPRD